MTVAQHEHNHNDHININTIDPTKTLTLRDRFSRDVNKRFRALKGVINKSIIENDVFGLIERPTIFQGQNLTPLPPKLFEFKTIEQKVTGFMLWLRQEQEKGILEIVQAPLGTISPTNTVPWTNTYIQHSYQKGIARGKTELIKAGADIDPFGAEGLFRPEQSITQVFNQPFHATRAAALYTRTFSELRGITEAMDQQISRVLTDGLLAGLNPRVIARNINNRVEKIGAHRARLLARTEVIRAHHVANIQEYRAAEIEQVVVRAEWLTAGDKRVCPRCAGFEGRVFSLKQIEPLIPLHPNCRCLLDGQVKIYTSKGWKAIRDIVVGDLVLTHKNRFMKVIDTIRTPKQTPDVVRFGFGGTQQMNLSVTDNHKIFVNDSWVEARNLKIGDKINYLAHECKRESCKIYTPYYKDYCSRTCLSKDITDRQWSNPEHRKNMSEKASKQMLREYRLGIRDKYEITKEANKKVRELIKKGEFVLQFPENHALRIMSDRGFIVPLEKKMKTLLDKLQIEYIHQHSIKNYFVDFAIPSLRIVIECDERSGHSGKEKKKKDLIRQRKIEREGWHVVRYDDEQINCCLMEVEKEILKIVCNHDGDYKFVEREIKNIKKWKVKRPIMLYNLTVEKDHSYIANGFVIKNCVALPLVPRDRRFGPAARRRQITPGQIRKGRAGELPPLRIPGRREVTPRLTPQKRNLVPAADNLATCLISDNIGTYIFTTLVRPDACKDIYREGNKYFQQGKEITDKKTLKRIDKLAIPPAWRDVVIATDPKAKMQAIGLDAAGRWQSRYSIKSIQKATQKKFNRIKSFDRDIPTILRKMDADVNLNKPEAMLLRLESKTAIRAGSQTDFKARTKAYGLTTLQNEHLTIVGDRITLEFVAKEGIPVKYELTDRTLAKWLLERKAATQSGEMLFPDVTASRLNTYIKKLANGKKYTIKDFRTYHGTRIAKDELEPYISERLTVKERKEVIKKVTEVVSSFLKNTPIMAKNSYINPQVWETIGGLP